jgi:hypothetical protein
VRCTKYLITKKNQISLQHWKLLIPEQYVILGQGEEVGGRKADKRKLVNVVSVETANKFAYVIL